MRRYCRVTIIPWFSAMRFEGYSAPCRAAGYLEIWDDRLARYGDAIAKERASYIEKLEGPARELYAGFPKIRNVLEYSIKKAPKI